MTPEEKAKAIFNEYLTYFDDTIQAKAASLIAARMILKVHHISSTGKWYWETVIKELSSY